MTMFNDEIILAVDSHNGIYSPSIFVERYGQYLNLSIEDKQKLSSPNNEFYWEVFDELLGRTITIEGKEYDIVQNEDIWLVPSNLEIPDDFWI